MADLVAAAAAAGVDGTAAAMAAAAAAAAQDDMQCDGELQWGYPAVGVLYAVVAECITCACFAPGTC